MGYKVVGAAPGFEPRTSGLRVRSVTITLRGPPLKIMLIPKESQIKNFQGDCVVFDNLRVLHGRKGFRRVISRVLECSVLFVFLKRFCVQVGGGRLQAPPRMLRGLGRN